MTRGRYKGAWHRRARAGSAALLGLCTAVGAFAQNITAATATGTEDLLRAAGDPSVAMAIWSEQSDQPPAHYRRNPRVWTGPELDLTGKAVWNSATGRFGTTAISPRHVVYAAHVKGLYPVGTIVRFVTATNEVVERLVVASAAIGTTDIDVSKLDAPLPDTIHWYALLPAQWYLQCSRHAPGLPGTLPGVVLDANTESVAVKDFGGFTATDYVTITPVDPLRRAFTRELYSGDSGSPIFIIVGHQLLLEGIYHTAAGGSDLSSHLAELNAAMAGSGYQVTVANLGAPGALLGGARAN